MNPTETSPDTIQTPSEHRMQYEPIPTPAELEEIGARLETPVTWERRIVGGQSATTDILRRHDDDSCVAVRRHGRWTIGFDDGIARREHLTLTAVKASGIPAPAVLWSGPLGATSAVITELVDGSVIIDPLAPTAWADSLAETLALVHGVEVDTEVAAVLNAAPPGPVDVASREAFSAHPDGERMLAVRSDLTPDQPTDPTLVHGDYWPGNVLWSDGSIVAVLDWESAAIGDRARDVGYCATEMRLLGFDSMADRFIDTYRARTGAELPSLPYWIVSTLCYALIDLPSYLDSWRGLGHDENIDAVRTRLQHLIDQY